jgi:hypothetical protein
LNSLVVVVARLMDIELAEVLAPGKERCKVEARGFLCFWGNGGFSVFNVKACYLTCFIRSANLLATSRFLAT